MTTISGETTPQGLLRVDRFEWERWIRRLPLSPSVRLLALTICTYAGPDGDEVRPGDDRLRRVLRCNEKTIRRNRQALIDAGLLHRVNATRARGRADEYVLTVPPDVAYTPGILDPNEWDVR